MRTAKLFAAVMSLALLSAAEAQAGIITYTGNGELGIEFLSIDPFLLVTAEDTTFGDVLSSGNGLGTQGFSVLGDRNNLLAGDSVTAFSTVGGFSPADSDSNATGAGLITFFNPDIEPGTFSLRASWNLSVETTLGPVDPGDYGLSQAFPFLLDPDSNDLLNGGAGVFLFTDTALGGGLYTDSGFNILSFSLNPGETYTLDLVSTNYGFASSTAAVPEPSSFALMSIGGLLIAGMYRWGNRRLTTV